ncbi:MAG: hypothetical protein RLO50_07110, partial [Azospirillaceae bacterium]
MRRHLIPLLCLLLAASPAGAQLPDPADRVTGDAVPGDAMPGGDALGELAGGGGDAASAAAGTTTQGPEPAGPASGLLLGDLGDGTAALLDSVGLELPGDLGALLTGEAGLIFDRRIAAGPMAEGEANFVPGEVLVLRPSTALLQSVQADGFRIVSVERFDGLGAVVARLAVPAGLSAPEARQRLADRPDPPVVTLNDLYRREQTQWVVPQETIWGQVGWREPCSAPLGIGVVDTAIDPAVAGAAAAIEQRDVRDDGGGSAAGEHGNAVAAILASDVAE